MALLYFFCFIPLIVGFILFLKNDTINIFEWLGGAAAAFVVAGIIHSVSYYSQVYDTEVWSGKITKSTNYSSWHEYYEEAIYRTETYTTGSGKNRQTHTRRVFSHYAPRTRWHRESFDLKTDINSTHSISKEKFNYLVNLFNNKDKKKGKRTTFEHNSRMIGGDPYDYFTECGLVVEPIHESRSFINRLIASKSVFNFAPIPEGTKIFEYPQVGDIYTSQRLVGAANGKINIKKWDQMNARLGVSKKSNIILVGFDSKDSMLAEWQRAKWVGGKKNDLVLCYGDGWVKVFGWSDADICKKNLESILLRNPINDDIVPLIEKEVLSGYQKTNWSKFDHLSIEPKTSHWVLFFVIMILTQGGLYFYFHQNEHNK